MNKVGAGNNDWRGWLGAERGPENRQGRLLLLAASMVLFVLLFVLLYPALGNASSLTAVLPVVVAGWFFGLQWAVLITLVLVLPVYMVTVSQLVGYPWYDIGRSAGTPALMALLLIAVIAGMMRGTHDEIRRQKRVRKKAEIELQESELRLGLMVGQMPAVLWSTDRELRFTSSTGAGLRALDVAPGQMVGTLVADFLGDDPGSELALDGHRRALAGETVSFSLHWQERDFRMHLEPLLDSRGEIVGALGLALDVTDQKRAELAMQQAQKLESLGVMAGGIAHDFNNLLVAMLGQISLAAALIDDAHAAESHLAKAVQAAEQAAALTRQMLVFAGRDRLARRPVNLNTLIRDNIHLFQVTLPKGIKIETDLAPDLPPILGDAGQLQQVIVNLLLNAAESHIRSTGAVLLTTRSQDVSEAMMQPMSSSGYFLSRPLEPGRYASLSVQDNGVGMDSETLQHIFDPFFTTKEKGHGLGLAAVLGIVNGHGGSILVTSAPGVGTRFEMCIPTSDAAEVEQVLPEVRLSSITATALVLVIDDDPGVRQAVADVLALENIDALLAADGLEGVALYQEHQADIDLVLLDLTMPGLSGEETLRALRLIDNDARVALMSGFDEARITRQPGLTDSVAFLQKPYDVNTLLDFVTRQLTAGQS